MRDSGATSPASTRNFRCFEEQGHTINYVKLVIALTAWLAVGVHAQPETGEEFKAGFDDTPGLGGASGVSEELSNADERREAMFEPALTRRLTGPWFDWKRQLNEEHGVALGLNAYWLYQHASGSLGDNDEAFGGIYRFQGSWQILDRGGNNPGFIEWRVEKRSNGSADTGPSSLSRARGIASLDSGFGYTDSFDTDLSVLNWTQSFMDDRVGLAVGRLAFDAYLDGFPFQTFSRGFLNRSFILSPTVGTTGTGALGFVAKGFVTENIWIGGQLHDGNAVSGDFDWDTFEHYEWLQAVEIGWTPGFEHYDIDRVQLTYWFKDERKEAGIPEGEGWVLSAAYKLGDSLYPFLRAGHSDGGAGVAAEDAVAVGLEWELIEDQYWSLGVGWARPSEKTFGKDIDDEYVFETSYKFQLLPNLSLTPDIQYIENPARNEKDGSVWVLGVRSILTL